MEYTVKRNMKGVPLFALLTANGISVVGNVLAALAIPWFVLQTTGSAAQMGLTACVEVVANLVAGVFGGTLVDRVGQKRISVLADLASGFAIALVPLLYYTVGLAFWQLLVLVFCASLCNAPGATALTVLLPDVADLAGMPFERASSILQAIQRAAGLVGAPAAGALIVVLGTTRLLWADAVSFLLSACIVALAIPASRIAASAPRESAKAVQEADEGVKEAAEEQWSWWAGLQLSFQSLWGDRLMLAIMGVLIITNLLDASLIAVVMPIYAKVHFGNALVFGLLSAAFGGGALFGSFLFSLFGVKLPRRMTFILAFLGMGLPFWALAFLPALPVLLLASAIGGIASAPINPVIMTLSMERVPAPMRGRVLGPLIALARITVPLGLLLVGGCIERLGLQGTLFLMAGAYLLATLSLLFNPNLRQMDKKPEREKELVAVPA